MLNWVILKKFSRHRFPYVFCFAFFFSRPGEMTIYQLVYCLLMSSKPRKRTWNTRVWSEMTDTHKVPRTVWSRRSNAGGRVTTKGGMRALSVWEWTVMWWAHNRLVCVLTIDTFFVLRGQSKCTQLQENWMWMPSSGCLLVLQLVLGWKEG